jgi:hypothetical protein
LIAEDGQQERSRLVVKRIGNFLGILDFDVDEIIKNMINKNRATYSSPSVPKWKRVLTKEQCRIVNNALPNELVNFGYLDH